MSSDEGFSEPKSVLRRKKKMSLMEMVRTETAEKYGIPYSPDVGEKKSPRKFATPGVTTPRSSGKKFNPESPEGRAHAYKTTETTQRKYCTFANAMKHFPEHKTPYERARNLDGVLNVCMDDIAYRVSYDARDATDYDEFSNVSAWLDMYKLFYWLVTEVQLLASTGVNVGDFLDNMKKYETRLHGMKTALGISLATPKRVRDAHAATAAFLSPVKMMALED